MLSNVTNITSSTAKPLKHARLWPVSVAILTLLILAFPSFAATPQPQSQPPSATPLQAPNAPTAPNATCPPDGQCFADVPSSNPFFDFINRIYQQDLVTGYPCGGPGEPCDPESRPYYRPVANVTRQQMAKFIDNARRLPRIDIEATYTSALIIAQNDANPAIRGVSNSGNAIVGVSTSGDGLHGSSDTGNGVYGISATSSAAGVFGRSPGGYGVFGFSTGNTGAGMYGYSSDGKGVYGISDNYVGVYGGSTSGQGVHGWSTTGSAGYFDGNVQVTGNLSKGGGSFKIDDPLDPANKYLYHSFVESPDMMNVYNGNVTTDDKGEAVVTLPAYFEALNRDYRYQLTIMGDQFAQARVSSEIKDNSFTIKTDKPTIKVSWQVTGIRQDPYANAHRIPVEEEKPANEKGKYLHPTEWGRPASSGVDYEEQQKMQDAGQPKP